NRALFRWQKRVFGLISCCLMALIVQKFGGTSVADIDRIANVARKVKKELDLGNKVAVVVSAMAGVTDQLVGLVRQISPLSTNAAREEYDAVVSSGEQVTSGLLALTLNEMGISARSWFGWQIPLISDGAHSRARIADIRTGGIRASLDAGSVAV